MIKAITEENCTDMCRVIEARDRAANNSYMAPALTEGTNKLSRLSQLLANALKKK